MDPEEFKYWEILSWVAMGAHCGAKLLPWASAHAGVANSGAVGCLGARSFHFTVALRVAVETASYNVYVCFDYINNIFTMTEA